MAEENNDLIEENNDDIQNWIYYNHERKAQESPNANTFTDSEQQLVYIEYGLIDGREQKFQYENCNDKDLVSSDIQAHNLPENCDQTEENVDDKSKHSLILREAINENGQLVEEYFCQQCNLSYQNIEHFLSSHPCFEMVTENTEEATAQHSYGVKAAAIENKLWDLVEDLEDDENIIEDETDVKSINLQCNDSAQGDEFDGSNIETDKDHYFCYDCQQVFTDLATAENHDCSSNELINTDDLIEVDRKMLAENDNVYKCGLCNKDYPSLRSFTNHQRWHKRSETLLGPTKALQVEPSVCTICNTIFACEKNLKLHMKMHKKLTVKTIQDALPAGAQEEYNDLNQFFCELCNKSFDQNLLVIHKNMHQNVEEYSCGKCNKNFENLPSYEIHMQMHMDSIKKEKTTKLNETEEEPSTSGQGLTDGGKRKHACQYCGKVFLRPYEKVKHERIHTGEKPYECEVCGKTFRVSYSLTLHLRTHTDIRPYVCPTCHKRFKQQSVYMHHLRTHDTECAYKCDICGKSFRTSVQLAGHKNIHSKPYNCTECNRPFASLYAVKIHMKTHNKGHKSNKNLKNSCSICGASYARVFALSAHIKEQHGIDVDPMKLAAENEKMQRKMQATLLMNTTSNVSDNPEMNFINNNDEDDDEVNNEENNETVLPHVYIDETEAATQTILNTEEISVDHFTVEEIITDW